MAERLKDSYGSEMAERVAGMLSAVDPGFDSAGYVAVALAGYEDLELMGRGRQLGRALAGFLPEDPCEAARIIRAALPPIPEARAWRGMQGFVLLPFGEYLAEYCTGCFEEAMATQYEITKRFTSEFSIRVFIRTDPERTLARLREWARDPDEHVRRLVSEGTRPRLPWAPQLQALREEPAPALELLELLKDDPSEYVRRSVANNLNDIGKDHPGLLVDVAAQWWADGDDNRRALVRRALRSLVKVGDPAALDVLGYRPDPSLSARVVVPGRARIGESLPLTAEVTNTGQQPVPALVDFIVGFARPGGKVSEKVFKGGEVQVPPGGAATIRASVSLRLHSTRKTHAGPHTVAVLLNGSRTPAATVEVAP